MNPTYDAIVVGAGSVGAPAAWFLAERGLKVLVLDKRASAGRGDNSAAIGGVRATHSDPAKITICRDSLDILSSFEEEHGIDVGFKPGGYVYPVFEEGLENLLKGLLPIQKRFNLDIDWVDADTIAGLIPGVTRERLRGGTYSPGDGQASPLKTALGFQKIAERKGAEFRFGETVTGYLVEGGRFRGVRTARATYSAPAVVVATGADAAADGALLGIDLPVKPDLHEAGISAPMEPFLAPLVVDMRRGDEGRTANFYFGQNSEGQIIFCYTPVEPIWGDNRESTHEFLSVMARRMIDLLPRLRHMLIRRTWRGCYPNTPDGVPILDSVPGIEGLTVAVGMCGQGFMLGPGAGRRAAALLVDGDPMLPEEAYETVRFGRDFGSARTEALK